jgi:hypothetical protein
VPKIIQINWKGTLGGCPVGYQFVHTPDWIVVENYYY